MQPWHNLKLRTKFFFTFGGLVTLIVILFSVVVFFFQQNLMRTQAEDKAFRLTQTLAYTSLNAILLDDYAVAQLLIDSMKEGQDILSIMLLDSNNRVIAGDDPGLRGTLIHDPLTHESKRTDQIQLVSRTLDNGQTVWETSVPVSRLNQQIGTVRITFLAENVFAGLFESIAGIGVVAMIVSLILAFYLASLVVRPITEASNLAQAYGRGDFDQKIPEPGEDEIGQMVKTLNQLSGQLEQLIKERSAHEGLVMIGEFASYIIHDLKNPLNGMHLLADGLHRRLEPDSPLRKYSSELLLASQRIEDFIRRTLDIARSTELNLESLDINALVNKAVDEVSINSSVKHREFDQAMPEIRGDYRLLYMAIKNLLINALEATREYGEVSVATHYDAEISIIIRDTGCGIPPEKLEAVFRPFFSMKSQGHGLGLAMAKRAVALHSGDIRVESRPDTGSVFTVTLPPVPHEIKG